MSNKILLITSHYPADQATDKNFVLPELQAFINAGKHVTLLPLHRLGEKLDPDLPPGITVSRELSVRYNPLSLLIGCLRLIISSFFYREIRSKGIKILTSPIRAWNFVKHSMQAINVYETLKTSLHNNGNLHSTDVIYTYWACGTTVGAAEYVRKYAPNIVLQTRMHGYDIYEERESNKGYIPYRSYVLTRLDRVILLSQQACQYLTGKHANISDKIHICPMGTKIQSHINAPAFYDDSCVTFVSCSLIKPVKRVKFIFETIQEVAKQNPNKNISWIHFGVTKNQLNFSVTDTPPNLTCDFKGYQPVQYITDAYSKVPTGIFINLSLSEGQPVSIMEAMACGLPILATDVGGVSEVLGNKAGYLFSINDTATLIATHITNKLTQKTYQEMSKAALKQQRSYFDIEKNCQRLVELT